MIHLLEQKVWQIQDERGKFEKKLGWWCEVRTA